MPVTIVEVVSPLLEVTGFFVVIQSTRASAHSPSNDFSMSVKAPSQIICHAGSSPDENAKLHMEQSHKYSDITIMDAHSNHHLSKCMRVEGGCEDKIYIQINTTQIIMKTWHSNL